MYNNPMFKIVAIVVGVVIIGGFLTLVLPAMAALAIVGAALLGLLSFSGWIARLLRGENPMNPEEVQTQHVPQGFKKSGVPSKHSWKSTDVQDAVIIEEEKK